MSTLRERIVERTRWLRPDGIDSIPLTRDEWREIVAALERQGEGQTLIGYIIEASGHGSKFRFGERPRLHATQEAAQAEARRWQSTADTIGGDARVVPIYRMGNPTDVMDVSWTHGARSSPGSIRPPPVR